MVILKLILMIFICYLLAKGLSSNAEKLQRRAEDRTKEVQDAAKEAYQLMQAEKTILTNTIKELREELLKTKGK